MDTRTKILSWDEAKHLLAPSAQAQVVIGHFDPLLAAHARRLRELAVSGRPLIAVVTDPPQPLLPQRARAELVAALVVVDHVILAPTAAPLLFPDGIRPIREEARDAERTRDLIQHVHRRQGTRLTVADG